MTSLLSRGTFAAGMALPILLLSAANAAPTTQAATAPSPATTTAATRPADDPEVQQLWKDAVNAFATGQDEKALELLNRLMAMNPNNVDYHLLAARALTLQNKWKEAGVLAQWVLDHPHQDFQGEWASLVRAQAASKAGDNVTARAILKDLSANATSATVKTTASQIMDQLEP